MISIDGVECSDKKSYVAFEQSLKLFFKCFNYKTVEYYPIMRQPSNK